MTRHRNGGRRAIGMAADAPSEWRQTADTKHPVARMRELLTQARDISFDLEHAGRLSTGLERLSGGGIDVILLDLSLPDARGLDVLRRVHAQAPDVPTLILTSPADEGLAREAVREGAQDYLVRGRISTDLLVRAVRYAIERVRIEAIRTQEKEELRLFKAVVESSNEAVAISDPEGRLVYVNLAHERLFGRPLGEARQINYRDCYPPESVEVLDLIVAPALARGESWEGELDALDADGRRFPLWERADSLRDTDGNMLYGFGFMHDITERVRIETIRTRLEETIRRQRDHLEEMVEARTAELTQANKNLQREIAERVRIEGMREQAEEKLRESEERFRSFAENAAALVCEVDTEGRYLYVNPAYTSTLGYEPRELLERQAVLLLHPDDVVSATEKFGLLVQGNRPSSDVWRFRHRDGEWRWFHCCGNTFRTAGGEQRVVVVSTDITEQRQAEHALRESEASLARAQQVAHLGSWNWDVADTKHPKKARTLTWSDELYRIFGVEEGFELTYEAIEAMIHPDDRETNRSYVNRLLTCADAGADCSDLYEVEFRIIRPDGTVRHIFQNAEILRDEAGNASRIFGIMQDITERKRTEQALAERTDALRQRNEELVALNAIAATVSESLDVQEVLDRALDKVLETTGMEAGSIYLVDPLTEELVLATYRGVSKEFAEAVRTFKMGQSLVGHVGQSGEPIVMDDASGDPRVSTPLVSGEGIRAFASVPMKSREKVQGVMAIGSHQVHPFGPEAVWLYTAIAHQIGMAVENARLFEQVQAGREQLARLTRRLVSAQEGERAWLARELHDELGQALTAIGFDLEMVARELPPVLAPKIVERLTEARSLTARADERVSELALDLRPDMLDDFGLVPALRWYANKWARRLNIEVSLDVVAWEEGVPPEMETALYRIVQEALTNVARHAQANRVRVSLERLESAVIACVEDDGQGFDVKRITHSDVLYPPSDSDPPQATKRGVGLLGIRERAASLGGKLRVSSHPGRGTRLRVEIPT